MLPNLRVVIAATFSTLTLAFCFGLYASFRLANDVVGHLVTSGDPATQHFGYSADEIPARISLRWPVPDIFHAPPEPVSTPLSGDTTPRQTAAPQEEQETAAPAEGDEAPPTTVDPEIAATMTRLAANSVTVAPVPKVVEPEIVATIRRLAANSVTMAPAPKAAAPASAKATLLAAQRLAKARAAARRAALEKKRAQLRRIAARAAARRAAALTQPFNPTVRNPAANSTLAATNTEASNPFSFLFR